MVSGVIDSLPSSQPNSAIDIAVNKQGFSSTPCNIGLIGIRASVTLIVVKLVWK
jgi:hypothetical protein